MLSRLVALKRNHVSFILYLCDKDLHSVIKANEVAVYKDV